MVYFLQYIGQTWLKIIVREIKIFAFRAEKTFTLHIRLVLRNKFSDKRLRSLSLMSSDKHTDYRHIHAVSTDVHLIYRNFVLLLLLLGCVDHVDAAEVLKHSFHSGSSLFTAENNELCSEIISWSIVHM